MYNRRGKTMSLGFIRTDLVSRKWIFNEGYLFNVYLHALSLGFSVF